MRHITQNLALKRLTERARITPGLCQTNNKFPFKDNRSPAPKVKSDNVCHIVMTKMFPIDLADGPSCYKNKRKCCRPDPAAQKKKRGRLLDRGQRQAPQRALTQIRT